MKAFLFKVYDEKDCHVKDIKIVGEKKLSFATKAAKREVVCYFPDHSSLYTLKYIGITTAFEKIG